MTAKRVLLGLFCLLLCGCSASVDLYIEDDVIREVITVDSEDKSFVRKNIPSSYLEPNFNDDDDDIKLDGVLYYDYSENGNLIKYSNDFSLLDYNNARSINTAFKNILITNSDDSITYNLSSLRALYDYQEYGFESVKINIHSKYKVIESNADDVINNSYVWYFDLSNWDSKSVMLKISNTRIEIKNDEDKGSSITTRDYVYLCVFGVLFFALLVIGIRAYVNIKNSNR